MTHRSDATFFMAILLLIGIYTRCYKSYIVIDNHIMNRLLWNKETVQECYDEAKSSSQESEESGADAANESDDSSVEEY